VLKITKFELALDDIERAEIIWKKVRLLEIKEVLCSMGLVGIFCFSSILTICINVLSTFLALSLALSIAPCLLLLPRLYDEKRSYHRKKYSKLLKGMRFSILLLIINKYIEKYKHKKNKKRLVDKMDNISKVLASKEKKKLTRYLKELGEKEELFDEYAQSISFNTIQNTKIKIKKSKKEIEIFSDVQIIQYPWIGPREIIENRKTESTFSPDKFLKNISYKIDCTVIPKASSKITEEKIFATLDFFKSLIIKAEIKQNNHGNSQKVSLYNRN
jgi:hypothetical protein